MTTTPTPDLDRLLRIAAAELPPGTTLIIEVGLSRYSFAVETGGTRSRVFATDLEMLAEHVEHFLRMSGLVLTEREDDGPCCPECGEDDRKKLAYDDAYANGDRWKCLTCGREFIVRREEKE